jgi:hypothetical protein
MHTVKLIFPRDPAGTPETRIRIRNGSSTVEISGQGEDGKDPEVSFRSPGDISFSRDFGASLWSDDKKISGATIEEAQK